MGRDFQGQRQKKCSREGVNPDMSRNPQDRVIRVPSSFSNEERALEPPAIPLSPLWWPLLRLVCRLAGIAEVILCVLPNMLFWGTIPFPLQYEIPRELPIVIANPAGHSGWSNQWSHEPRLHQSEIFQVGLGGKHLSLPGGIFLSRYESGATNCCVVAQSTPVPAPQLKK